MAQMEQKMPVMEVILPNQLKDSLVMFFPHNI
jgi:hypothetical protein